MSPRLRLWLQARERRMEGGPLPLSAVAARRRVTDALWSRLSARSGAVARFSLGTLVGRGGLEPPTSAVDTAKRCADESGGPSVRLRIMWCAESRIASAARMAVDKPHHLTRSAFYRDRCRKASVETLNLHQWISLTGTSLSLRSRSASPHGPRTLACVAAA